MAVNLPLNIPAYNVMSFNLNGAISDIGRKLKWVYNTFVKTGLADIVLFQELHWKDVADMRKAFWPYRGVLRGLSMNPGSATRGVVAWIPGDSTLKGLVHDVCTDSVGRWSLIKIAAQSESQHILNVYAPSTSVAARETFFEDLEGTFDDYSGLLAGGDWNFVSRDIDNLNLNGPHPPDKHPVAEAWLDSLELLEASGQISCSLYPTGKYFPCAVSCLPCNL
jgi:exonuclease III